MTRKLSTFAIMACLASSLAFAGDKAKPASSADNVKPETTQAATSNNIQQDGSSPCVAVKDKKKKNKHDAKPAPSDQERVVDKVLQGMYG
jgi:hypothetical protein